ncbi:MAG TPA: diguanylate cyclase [Telluria sp.]|nr:diguanylate cyclase [Telluria sp.]
MLAGFKGKSPRSGRRWLLASLCLVATVAAADVPVPLDARLADIREVNRFVPEKALAMLGKIDSAARAAPAATKAEFLTQLSLAYGRVGRKQDALAVADQVIALGKAARDDVALAKGLLTKGYIVFQFNELKRSHELLWEGEKIANTTGDLALRVQAAISSGDAHAEEGNFPEALRKHQEAVTLARQYGQPVQMVMALNALAQLYDQTRQFDKGFEALAEATEAAEKADSPGRMAMLKKTEFFLATDTDQPERGMKALLAELELERRIGANSMIATSLVNLSDSYLKQRDYARTLSYAHQAIEVARRIDKESTEATARINIGQAYLGMGRVAEGKRSFEAGLAFYDKQGDKPELQSVLAEYGDALERAGDMVGAIEAYHRERKLSNELFEKQRQKAMWELQEKYEAEKKQRQIQLLSRENEVKSAEIDNRRLQQRVWWLLALVFALASVIVGILYRKVRTANAQLQVKNLELKQQSSRDPLTSLYNRRHFQEFMRSHLQAERPVEKRGVGTSGEEICGALFLLDVDHFKHVNDAYGHAAGDAVLKMIAESLHVILRETDMIVRWGGEEFLAFLPAIPRSGVEEIARRLLTGISAHTIDYQDSKISVNVSIGFAPFPLVPGEHPLPWERAVNLVDMALYLAKAHGRNRAYGVCGFANFEQTSMEHIEQDLERAWRAGFVDLSIVLGNWPTTKPAVVTA